uniref:Pentraxin family member n=1 Tax=Oryzias sinensis TaxID=183150 RepID=A0A8C7VAK9_9TELE
EHCFTEKNVCEGEPTISALSFPKESHEGFARVNISFPALSAISMCVRVQWDRDWNDVSTIFSYAAPVFTNEFQLRGQLDVQGRVLLALIIHGKHLPYKASFPNDGAWHHICVTWRRSGNHWAIYVDGESKDTGSGTDTNRDIHGDGILILGQDQDSFGGNFTEPFFGNITDLNVWTMVGCTVEQWLSLLSQSKKATVHVPAGTFLCGVFHVLPVHVWFFSSHSPKTCLGVSMTLNCSWM